MRPNDSTDEELSCWKAWVTVTVQRACQNDSVYVSITIFFDEFI